MRVTPVTEAVGAEVHGVDLTSLSDLEATDLESLWAKHGVLFFRDQHLSPHEHVALAKQLGDIDVNRFFAAVDGHSEIARVVKEASDLLNIGGGWHTDHSYDIEPARGSILVARELPPIGGDTRFLSTEAAYRSLPDELRSAVDGRMAFHTGEHIFGPDSGYAKKIGERFAGSANIGQAEHPAVIAHPVSGAPILYVNPGFTTHFVDMDPAKSKELLDALFIHMDQPQHSYQFTWEPGSVAIWDNRSTWHWALNDYPGYRRLMHRITLAGDALRAAEPLTAYS